MAKKLSELNKLSIVDGEELLYGIKNNISYSLEVSKLKDFLLKNLNTNIVNDLTTGGINSSLSAEQGKKLNEIKVNKTEIYDKIEINSKLSTKVDKVEGKQLSTEDYTTDEKTKLSNLINYDISTKQDKLVSGSNIKTINGSSILGSGNIEIQGSGGGIDSYTKVETDLKLDNKVDKITGKILSSNDFTNNDKSKLDLLNNYDDSEIKLSINNEINRAINAENKLEADKANKSEVISEANKDGKEYIRKNGIWSELRIADITDIIRSFYDENNDNKIKESITAEAYNNLLFYAKNKYILYSSKDGPYNPVSCIQEEGAIILMQTVYMPGGGASFIWAINVDYSLQFLQNLLPIQETVGFCYLTGYTGNAEYNKITEEDTIISSINKLDNKGMYKLNVRLLDLTYDSTSQQISESIGGIVGLKKIIDEAKEGNSFIINDVYNGINRIIKVYCSGYELYSDNTPKQILLEFLGSFINALGGFVVLSISYDKDTYVYTCNKSINVIE